MAVPVPVPVLEKRYFAVPVPVLEKRYFAVPVLEKKIWPKIAIFNLKMAHNDSYMGFRAPKMC